MSGSLDEQMESASQALARMDYLECEAYCLAALQQARCAGDLNYYARILLPLQECRRQRRLLAAEGVVQLGTPELAGALVDWLDSHERGCVVVTQPYAASDAQMLAAEAQRRRRYVEVLFADSKTDDATWTLRSFAGPAVSCEVPAPPKAWIGTPLEPRRTDAVDGRTPGDWLIDATEALGNAALDQLGADATLADLEAQLEAVSDHEFLHQHLADAARRAARDASTVG